MARKRTNSDRERATLEAVRKLTQGVEEAGMSQLEQMIERQISRLLDTSATIEIDNPIAKAVDLIAYLHAMRDKRAQAAQS